MAGKARKSCNPGPGLYRAGGTSWAYPSHSRNRRARVRNGWAVTLALAKSATQRARRRISCSPKNDNGKNLNRRGSRPAVSTGDKQEAARRTGADCGQVLRTHAAAAHRAGEIPTRPMAGEGPKVALPSGPPNRETGDRHHAPTGGGKRSRNRENGPPKRADLLLVVSGWYRGDFSACGKVS